MYHFDFRPVVQNFDLLLEGLLLSIGLALLSLAVGTVLGLLAAFARVYGPRPVRVLATAYVEFVRNIPLLLIVFFVYFGLPLMGVRVLNSVSAFVFALAIYAGAYMTEIFRAGIEAVSKAYLEAGKAIGLKRMQVIRYVTLPLMFRVVLPSLGNTFISLFKDTSLASAISVHELTFGAKTINVDTLRVIEVYVVVGVMYIVTSYSITGLLRLIERRFTMVR
jgi:polar amino acid transport system permease protein